MLRFPCLVLDHDDTVVQSTPMIHYPSFVHTLGQLRPEMQVSLEEFMHHVYDPGFFVYCTEVCGMTDEEMELQNVQWREYVASHRALPYDGFREIIQQQKAAGGLVCVVSHSSDAVILRDYEEYFGAKPDLIFSSDLPPEQRKPSPYPLQTILQTYALRPHELLMVDDLLPGRQMARSCGVPFAAAGWSQMIPAQAEDLRRKSDYYLDTVDSLRHLLFD
ncbi:MAG: HAD family hydrolase [Oscillospiraceae bacterium]|nr:HAD family hydrolase [Oscillospiraceae bacterium]